MKFVVLAAFLVAVTAGDSWNSEENQHKNEPTYSPWKVGKVYKYDVRSHTVARLQEGPSSGAGFRARLILRARAPGRLQVKLENPERAQFNQELPNLRNLPKDLSYEKLENFEKPFEVYVEGGRVLSMKMPSSLSLAQENLLKGLLSALQVDLSPHRRRGSSSNYDSRTQQGTFKKMETDVTGDTETLYTVSPIDAIEAHELPLLDNDDQPMAITKSKNYGHGSHSIAYHFGVPAGAKWSGTAQKPGEHQLVKRSTNSRIIASRKAAIHVSETMSTVHVSPHMYGKQRAEVYSNVRLNLTAIEKDNEPEWQMPENWRSVKNLLFAVSSKSADIEIDSSESSEHRNNNVQQDVQSEHSESRREKRSAVPKKVVSINKIIIQKRSDEDESSSSSSSSDSSANVNDDVPKPNEPAYAALYMNGQQLSEQNKNHPMVAQKLVQEIAQQIQNPNNMPKADALSKFSILVRIIASMTSAQLTQTSRSIESAKTSNNVIKSDMWMVWRDAVAESGTIPAFQQIKTWILSKKLKGEEAAEVVAVLPSKLRYPTKDLMTQFFELAMNPEVKQQAHLNNSALISATKFINMGHVNNETAHKLFPTHMYGRLTHKNDRFVLNTILPRLENELQKAIQEQDGKKTQVYIRAIGNLGHRAILDVFSPYLEQISTQSNIRRQMIDSLDVLAYERDHYVRSVLYSILKNTAEPYEIRVAAISIIFYSEPTPAMVQEMAFMTNYDPSIEVRAALKSGIETAAELKHPAFLPLARTAQAAKDLLTKEKFSYSFSRKEYSDYADFKHGLGVFNVLTYVGSVDSLLPKFLRYATKNQAEGWQNTLSMSYSFSSIRQFIDYVEEQMNPNLQNNENQTPLNHKYTAEKMAEILKLKWEPKEPFQGTFTWAQNNMERFFAFDESDMKQLHQEIGKLLGDLSKGLDYHYTKLYNQEQVSIMFPVAMGVPFIFKYKVPTLIHLQGKAKADIKFPTRQNRDYSAAVDNEVQFTFARNIDGSVGFLDTLSNQFASAGVVSKVQFHIPIKMQLQMQPGKAQLRFEPIRPDQDTNIVHYSVWPYTANQKTDSHVTVSQDQTTKVITRANKVSSDDFKFGQSATGMSMQLQGYSYSSDFRNVISRFHGSDFWYNLVLAQYSKDIALTHYNLKYLGKQSANKATTVTASYKKYYNLKENMDQESETISASDMQDISPDSESRRQQMMNKVSSGIRSPRGEVIDLSATFEGAQKQEYVLTAAVSNSPVDQKEQYAVFAGRNSAKQGNSQVNAVGKVVKPKIASLNLREALNQDLKGKFEFDIKFGKQGETGKINIQGKMERSKEFTEDLKNNRWVQEAEKDMAENNYYQPKTHRMIIKAHAPNHFQASVTYKDLNPTLRNLSSQAYSIWQYLDFWYTEVNPIKNNPDGKVDIELTMSYLEHRMNLMMRHRGGDLRVKSAPIPEYTVALLSAYWPITVKERLVNYYSHRNEIDLRKSTQSLCTVDGTKISTFSGRQYEYTLTPSWYVVMHDDAKYAGKYGHNNEQLVILARRPTETQQEVYMSYRSKTGQDVEIEMKPASQGAQRPSVKVNTQAQKMSEGDINLYYSKDNQEVPLLQYYTMPDGVIMLQINEDRLKAMYDGQRLVIIASENRNNTRGICGMMTGELRDDFYTQNGYVDTPEEYAASFALSPSDEDRKTAENQQRAKRQAYEPEFTSTMILRSDSEWEQAKNKESSSSSSSSSSEEQKWGSQNVYRVRYYGSGPCELKEQVQFYINHGDICITTTRLPSCNSKCHGEDYQIKAAQVVCRPKMDKNFQNYLDQIRKGENPSVSGVPKLRQFRVPNNCS